MHWRCSMLHSHKYLCIHLQVRWALCLFLLLARAPWPSQEPWSVGCRTTWGSSDHLKSSVCCCCLPADKEMKLAIKITSLCCFCACAEKLAASVGTSYGCYFVPAFSGLYAPYWEPSARGYNQDLYSTCLHSLLVSSSLSLNLSLCLRIICGLTQFTNKSHLAFAALEAVCFQTREVSCAFLSVCHACGTMQL